MGKLFALGLLGIAALTGGAVLFIYRATEPDPRRSPAGARGGVSAGFDPSAEAQGGTSPLGEQGAAQSLPLIPPGPPRAAGAAAPLPNERPPIQGPVPVALPTEPGELQDSLAERRNKRMSEQMDRLNRRNLLRGGAVGPTPPPPPSAFPPAPPGRPGRLGGARGSSEGAEE